MFLRRLNLLIYLKKERDSAWVGDIERHSDPRNPTVDTVHVVASKRDAGPQRYPFVTLMEADHGYTSTHVQASSFLLASRDSALSNWRRENAACYCR